MIKQSLAFVDLETTGATASKDRITEIGIIQVDGDQVLLVVVSPLGMRTGWFQVQ